MARIARAVVPDIAYHVTHRGNHREEVFLLPDDYEHYRQRLAEASSRYGMEIWAYCLMTNHVHLIVVPRAKDSLARGIGRAHRLHSLALNRRQGWTGHLWANRFYSCPLDDEHMWAAVKYVELNPVRTGLVARPEDYEWSSARAHVRGETDALLSPGRPFPGDVGNWSNWLEEGLSEEQTELIRRHTQTGRPLGSTNFLERMEGLLSRVLRPRKVGRRPKETTK